MKLNKDQKKLIADVFGNISVVWFAAGVTAPFFVKNSNPQEIVRSFATGSVFFLFFFLLAIYILKK